MAVCGTARSQVQILSPRFTRLRAETYNRMFCVYVLRSEKTGRRYVGSCEDLAERLRRHNNAASQATRHGVPWLLLHGEKFSSRCAAASKERYYNTGRGRDELDGLEVDSLPTNNYC